MLGLTKKRTGPIRVRATQGIVSETWSVKPGVVVELDAAIAEPFIAHGVLEETDDALTDPMAHNPWCRRCGAEGPRYDAATTGWRCAACLRWA
jgi:hypothetical protein